MMPSMKSYLRILIVVGVVLVVAAAAWYLMKDSKGGGDATLTPTPLGSIAPLASVSPLLVAYDAAGSDWKSYASASAGFKVSYPSDWNPSPCGPACVGWIPADAAEGQFALGIIRSTGTLAELIGSAQPYLAAQEEVKVGANTWTKLTLQQPTSGDIVTSHFIERGGYLFEFGTATSDAKILAVYGSMIRSFVFTK